MTVKRLIPASSGAPLEIPVSVVIDTITVFPPSRVLVETTA